MPFNCHVLQFQRATLWMNNWNMLLQHTFNRKLWHIYTNYKEIYLRRDTITIFYNCLIIIIINLLFLFVKWAFIVHFASTYVYVCQMCTNTIFRRPWSSSFASTGVGLCCIKRFTIYVNFWVKMQQSLLHQILCFRWLTMSCKLHYYIVWEII